jgi:hypothetical protein
MPTIDDFSRIAEAPLHTWLGTLIVSIICAALAIAIHRFGGRIVMRLAKPHPLPSVILRYINKPSLFVLVIVVLEGIWAEAPDTLNYIVPLRDITAIALIAALTWLSVRSAAAIGEAIIRAHPLDTADNLHARRIHTQARVLARSVMIVIVIVGVGGALMTFPNVRQIGASLLASAGVAGLVAGIAARPVLGRVGAYRGNYRHLCVGAAVGPASADRAIAMVYREPVCQLDAEQFANHRHGISVRRLSDAACAVARGVGADRRKRAGVGSSRAGVAGDGRHRARHAIARAGQFARFGAELGFALSCP